MYKALSLLVLFAGVAASLFSLVSLGDGLASVASLLAALLGSMVVAVLAGPFSVTSVVSPAAHLRHIGALLQFVVDSGKRVRVGSKAPLDLSVRKHDSGHGDDDHDGDVKLRQFLNEYHHRFFVLCFINEKEDWARTGDSLGPVKKEWGTHVAFAAVSNRSKEKAPSDYPFQVVSDSADRMVTRIYDGSPSGLFVVLERIVGTGSSYNLGYSGYSVPSLINYLKKNK